MRFVKEYFTSIPAGEVRTQKQLILLHGGLLGLLYTPRGGNYHGLSAAFFCMPATRPAKKAINIIAIKT